MGQTPTAAITRQWQKSVYLIRNETRRRNMIGTRTIRYKIINYLWLPSFNGEIMEIYGKQLITTITIFFFLLNYNANAHILLLNNQNELVHIQRT